MNYDKKYFNIFLKNKELVYLDSAATAQKPEVVISAEKDFYENFNANADRGVCGLSAKSSKILSDSRSAVARFINAKQNEVVFVSGATAGIFLLADCLGESLRDRDIVITDIEHNSNVLPWVALEKKLKVKVHIFNTDNGLIDLDKLNKFLKGLRNFSLMSFSAMSNVLGIKNDVAKIVKIIKNNSGLVCCDMCQFIAHSKVDMQKLDLDFMVFSGHKIYGPTGVGVLYINEKSHGLFDSFALGGGTVESIKVEGDKVVYKSLKVPDCLEGGTLPLAQIYSLSKAMEFVESVGYDRIEKNNDNLVSILIKGLSKIDGVKLVSFKDSSMVSFYVKDISSYDIVFGLGQMGVCVRGGKMCADLLVQKIGVLGLIRVSFGIYNDEKDVEILLEKLNKVLTLLRS